MDIDSVKLELNSEEIEETTIPSKTYLVQNGRIIRKTDGIEAVRQAVEKVLLTQLFEWVIYSETYGVETDRLIGQDFDFVKADIERTIEDALLYDDRVESIDDFEILQEEKESLHVSFTVNTLEGSFDVENEVML